MFVQPPTNTFNVIQFWEFKVNSTNSQTSECAKIFHCIKYAQAQFKLSNIFQSSFDYTTTAWSNLGNKCHFTLSPIYSDSAQKRNVDATLKTLS